MLLPFVVAAASPVDLPIAAVAAVTDAHQISLCDCVGVNVFHKCIC